MSPMINIATAQRITGDSLAQTILEAGKLPDSVAIIDVRDEDHVGGHIKGSINVPSTTINPKMPELVRALKDKEQVIFHCALSKQRGPAAAKRYLQVRQRVLQKAEGDGTACEEQQDESATNGKEKPQEVYVLDGGFGKWQEKYGTDMRLTEDYAPDIWRFGY